MQSYAINQLIKTDDGNMGQIKEVTDSGGNGRTAILQAARYLFLKNTYANISIRRIAEKAGVNSAMIAYYFGSKSGLFREMIKSYLEENLERGMASLDPIDQMALEDFLLNFYRSVPPELVHLVIRTMLFERSEMRDWLLDTLMKPAFDTATKIASRVIDHQGKPVEPLILRTVLQSLLLAPKLLQPLLQELNPETIDAEFYDRLAAFNAELIGRYFDLEAHQ